MTIEKYGLTWKRSQVPSGATDVYSAEIQNYRATVFNIDGIWSWTVMKDYERMSQSDPDESPKNMGMAMFGAQRAIQKAMIECAE